MRSRKPSLLLSTVLLLLITAGLAVYQQQQAVRRVATVLQPGACELYFSPKGGATAAVVDCLGRAQRTVLVQAYSFTSAPIAKALVQAKKRGVEIQVILDRSQRTANYSEADFLAHAKIPTYIDAEHAIAHNKVMVIDDATVITGSFNFTKAAEASNAENLLIIHDTVLAERYTQNWRDHLGHSERYRGR